MTTLAEVLPAVSPTVQSIYDHYKLVGDSEPARGYLGASIIGHHCTRYLWYIFRACRKPDFPGRMYRLFETGHREETRLLQNLRDVGCTVYDLDDKGEQFAISDFGGHFSGHIDCVVVGLKESPKTPHVGDCKTFSAKRFKAFKEKGIKVSDPKYYCQVQVYMHYLKLTRGFILGQNKDTDELHLERFPYCREEAEALVARSQHIITATEPPPRIADRPDYYECKYCDAHDICWGCEKALPLPVISCKQCCYATPLAGRESADTMWACDKHGFRFMAKVPCDDHLCLPGLFPYADPIDATDGLICFKNKDDGKEWNHGGFDYSTKDLMAKTREEL
jgi:hypothetical protein